MIKSLKIITLLAFLTVILSACTPARPNNVNNVCDIFMQYPSWYWATQKAQKKYGVPVYVQMAIIHQESRFGAKAKPPRTKILWVIPWFRPTTAYGYAQVLDSTWEHYQQKTGNYNSNRDHFGDAVMFVSWYGQQAHKRAGIPLTDANDLYLAYHEGVGGYMRGTYKKKAWLVKVAQKVQRQSYTYAAQLRSCQSKIPKEHWWNKIF